MDITVRYSSVDGFRKTRTFKTLKGAQKFATKYVGETPEFGSYYAVSFDGVGKITVSGTTLEELFPTPDAKDEDWENDPTNPDNADAF